MDLGLTDVQQELVGSFRQLLEKEASPERVRAAEPSGFDPALWDTLVATGVVTMAVPEERGGWGASMVDLALVAEQLGRLAAPAPVIETQVASRMLAGLEAVAAKETVGRVLAGEEMVTIALHAPVDRVARLVPGGATCSTVIVPFHDALVLAPVSDGRRHPIRNLADAPLADIDLGDDTIELANGQDAIERFQVALDEWMILTVAALVGLGEAAHGIACEYARERQAFGTPIGRFQGVSHPLADDATNLDGARLLTRKAAWSIDRGRPQARELASMAFAFASQTAERATYNALHTLGGYGFMLEYDVQLYYRRVRGWARVWGDADAATRRAAAARYTTNGER